MKVRIPHDRLFKELLGTFLYEFLQLFLPELAERVDASSLSLVDKELFPEDQPERRADLVVRARIREDAGESVSFFLIHLEHEAQNREPHRFPWRMLQYTLHLHDATGFAVYPIAYLRLEPEEERLFYREFDKISSKEKAIMTEYTTSWHQRGWESGRAEGFQAGREEGREKGHEEGREQGLEQGLEAGRESKALEVAGRLLGMGLSVEQVVQATDLSRERVESLARERFD